MRIGVLEITDLRIWAYHGWYEEERIIGGEYRIDVKFELPVDSEMLEIDKTVNYETAVDLIKNVMSAEFKLIESASTAIHDSLLKAFPVAKSLNVQLTKLKVPINGLHSTSFTVSTH